MELGPITIGGWDAALIVGVTAMATGLAYAHSPKWKALALSLPIPFTLATLAVGEPIGVAPMAGMVVMLAYTHAVRLLHYNARVPIVPSILLSVTGYCLISYWLAGLLPATDAAFWIASCVSLTVAVFFCVALPHRDEPGHRSPLAVHVKIPIIFFVIVFVVIIKKWLGGYISMFPMVGLIAAYEARHSLWTIGRQIPLLMVVMVPMLIVARVSQQVWGWPLGWALFAGWVVFLTILIPLQLRRWRSAYGNGDVDAPEDEPQGIPG